MNIQKLYQLYKCYIGYKDCDYRWHYYNIRELVKVNDLANKLDCSISSPMNCILKPALKHISYGVSFVMEIVPTIPTFMIPVALLTLYTQQPLLSLCVGGAPTALYLHKLWSSYDNAVSFLMAHDISQAKEGGGVLTQFKIDFSSQLIMAQYEGTVFSDIIALEKNNSLIVSLEIVSRSQDNTPLLNGQDLHAAILRQLYQRLEDTRVKEQELDEQGPLIEIEIPYPAAYDLVNLL